MTADDRFLPVAEPRARLPTRHGSGTGNGVPCSRPFNPTGRPAATASAG